MDSNHCFSYKEKRPRSLDDWGEFIVVGIKIHIDNNYVNDKGQSLIKDKDKVFFVFF